MFDGNNVIPIAFNMVQLFFQFSIMTTILKNKMRWWITLISSIIITSLYSENVWLMLGIFYSGTIFYYCLIVKMQLKTAFLAIGMQLFLSQFINTILRIILFALKPSIDLNFMRIASTLILITLFYVIRRFKIDTLNLTRDKTIFILSSTIMIVALVSLSNDYYSQFEGMAKTFQILNALWILAMQTTVIYLIFILNKFASEVENAELQQKYTKTLEESVDKLQGSQHSYYNFINTMQGYFAVNDCAGAKKYVNGHEHAVNIIKNKIEINASIKDNMRYIYGILLANIGTAVEKEIRFEIEVTANIFELKTLSEIQLSRIVGNILGNAMDHAVLSSGKYVKLDISNYLKDKIRIVVKNSIDEKVDTSKITRKGVSGKKGHTGFGLYEVQSIVDKQKKEGFYIAINYYSTDDTFTADLLV